MPKLQDLSYLMAKTETTIGTENAPTLGASVVKTYELEFQPIAESTNTERHPMTGVFGAQEIDVAGAFQSAVKCKTYMTGSGTLAVASPWAPLLIACGWQQNVTAATDVVYSPATAYAPGAWANNSDFAGMASLTMHMLIGDTAGGSTGMIYKTRGVMGDFTLDMEMGKPAAFTWDFKGGRVVEVDDTAWTAATVSTESDPKACMNVGATWTPNGGAAHSMVLRKFSLKNGANVSMRPDMNSVGGYISALATTRRITYSMEVEMPVDLDATAGADWYGHLAQTAAAHGVLEVGPVDSAGSGNRWHLEIAKAGFGKVTQSVGDGIYILNVEGVCATSNLSTGGDEITLTFD